MPRYDETTEVRPDEGYGEQKKKSEMEQRREQGDEREAEEKAEAKESTEMARERDEGGKGARKRDRTSGERVERMGRGCNAG